MSARAIQRKTRWLSMGAPETSGGRTLRRNRIVSVVTPGVAAADTTCCQPAAPQDAMVTNRMDGVARARRVEAAMTAQQRADQQLVAANQEDRDASHKRTVRSNKVSMLLVSAALSQPAAPGRAMTTMSSLP